jgi:hypothetical protein
LRHHEANGRARFGCGFVRTVTILVDERPDDLLYTTMASVFASYESPEALTVARRLDAIIVELLTAAAA